MARVHCKNLLRIYKPSFFFLFETHTMFNNLKNFWDNLSFHCVGIEKTVGQRGGIWFLSSIANASCVVIDQIDQCITVKVSVGNLVWLCSAVYGSPQFEKRSMLWDHLRSINLGHNGSWIVVGDFNEIVAADESTCAYFSSHRASLLATTLDDCELFDLKVTGRRYTWYRAVQAGRDLTKKLDRALVNEAWMTMFPEGYSEIFSRLHFDHCSILVRCHGGPRVKGSHPFRFQTVWTTHPSYKHVISKAWNQEFGGVTERLKMVQQASLDFNSKIFGNIFVRKSKLEYQIDQIQRRLEVTDVLSLRIKEAELREVYNRLLLQEELFWYQKSREQWVKYSQEEALSFYKNLFGTTEEVEVDCLGDVPMPTLSTEACAKLIDPVSFMEVKLAVFSMSPFKNPGPDGFQAYFFKEYWEIIGTEIWNIVRSAFLGEYLNPSIMETLIVLIPKIDNPTFMKDFRPISLCNVVYKIITKVLTNRLRPFLPDIVSPLQRGFIPGRGTPDNIIAAQEILNFMKHTKSKKGSFAFKIDLEKAYDRVDWRVLESTLIAFGFSIITATKSQVQMVMHSLNIFCKASGMKVNLEKSKAFCSKNVTACRRDIFTSVSSIRFSLDLGRYLRVNLNHSRTSRASFHSVNEKFLWKGPVDGRGLSLVNWSTDKPWVALLRAKYLRNEEVLDGPVPCNASHVWKSISKAFGALKDAFSWYVRDVWKDGQWNLHDIFSIIPEDVKQHLNAYNPDLNAGESSGWSWGVASSRLYSARSGYSWLAKRNFDWNEHDNWLWVWRLYIPEKYKFLIWLSLHNAIPTAEFHLGRGLALSSTCHQCQNGSKSILHCLRECPSAKEVWNLLGLYSDNSDLRDWLYRGARSGDVFLFFSTIWWIWRSRNHDLFNIDDSWNASKVVSLIRSSIREFHTIFAMYQSLSPPSLCLHWVPPPVHSIKLNCDASCFAPLGYAGFGCIIRNPDGCWLKGFTGKVEVCSVLFAELYAIWRGLLLAWENGFREVIYKTDCLEALFLVNQRMLGKDIPKWDLAKHIQEVMNWNWRVSILLIQRNANSVADCMAKAAASDADIHSNWSQPWSEFQHPIDLDMNLAN
ncbi:uncharacterized protein LOC107610797 [Arachis ipaensis]|uniref:uncharacterized protein LOC107610797 n=1 Tax=Arachis ipaensis TaxID=130454 RepID=UPI0007AF0A56|nr:uncharacterized protein LOC107610797 [Arachis ipaensis]